MPPMLGSRYSFCLGVRDAQGRRCLTDREPFRFRNFPDNRMHFVADGDTLFQLAGTYFAPLPRACGLWWVIADFQPEWGLSVVDPTLALAVGATLIIPSVRVVTEVILSEQSRRERA